MRSGGTPSKSNEDYWSGDIPWVSSGEMVERRIYDTDLKITDEAAKIGSRLVPAGTVLLVVRGMSLAKEFRVAIAMRQVAFNQDLKALECADDVHPGFLFYALLARKEYIRDLATEASHGTKKLESAVLDAVEILLPPRDEQERVASFVAAYDDLIDNNRRRIKLLEDSVRLLFDEWFVRLGFPGHERIGWHVGQPKGWTTATLQELCVPRVGIQTGPFGSQLHQSDYADEGVPVVMPKDLAALRVSVDSIARIPEALADELGRHRMVCGDIVFGRRGEIGRRAYIGTRQAGYFCGTGCLRLRADPARINPRLLFDMLGSPVVAGEIANRAKGSTMANLSAGALQSVEIPVPPRPLQDRFAEHAIAVGELIDVLEEQSRKLRTARDLLLPRLMSGEIEV